MSSNYIRDCNLMVLSYIMFLKIFSYGELFHLNVINIYFVIYLCLFPLT